MLLVNESIQKEDFETEDFQVHSIFEEQEYHRDELRYWLNCLERELKEVHIAIASANYHLSQIK